MVKQWLDRIKQSRKWLVVTCLAGVVTLSLIGGGAYALYLGGAGNGNSLGSAPIQLDKGVIARYRLAGNYKDSSSFGLAASTSGTAPTATSDREGVAGQAEHFNGSGYLTTPNIDISGGAYTVSLWVKADVFTGNSGGGSVGLIGQSTGTGTDGQIHLGIRNYHIWLGQYGDDLNGGTTLAPGVWYNLVYMIDGAKQQRVYVNGSLDGSRTATGYMSNGINEIGTEAFDGTLTGAMSDIRVYNRALSVAEVTALHEEYNPGLKLASGLNSLIGQWKFDGNANDFSSYGNPSVVNGATYTTDREGRPASAMTFSGSQYVYSKIGNGTYFGGNNPLSVAAWVYVTSSSSGPIFGITSAPPNGGWNMPFLSLSGTTIYGWIYNNSQIAKTVSANAWHHAVLSYNPGANPSTILYVDGVQAGTATGTYSSSGAADYFTTTIGGSKPPGVGSFLNTPLDDVRAYSRVLTGADVTSLYDSYNSQITVSNLLKGLTGYWAFNNGNAKDATSYGSNGTVNGATQTTDREGRGSSALSFNGSNNNVQMSVAGVGNTAAKQTTSAWFKPNNTGGTQDIVVIGNNSTAANQLRINAGRLQVSTWGGGTAVDSSTTVSAGVWHLATFTNDGTTSRLYLDGVLVGSSTTALQSATPTLFYVGTYGGGEYFNGSIDDVRLYNRPLSATEIQQLYQTYN